MGRFAPKVEKNHPNHSGQNKKGVPAKSCRYCQNIWDEKEFEEIEDELFKISQIGVKIVC
jgi:hypothetical protein